MVSENIEAAECIIRDAINNCSQYSEKTYGHFDITKEEFEEAFERLSVNVKFLNTIEEKSKGCGKVIYDTSDDGDRTWNSNCGDDDGYFCEECEKFVNATDSAEVKE